MALPRRGFTFRSSLPVLPPSAASRSAKIESFRVSHFLYIGTAQTNDTNAIVAARGA